MYGTSRTPPLCQPEHRQHCRHGARNLLRSLADLQERAESRKGSGLCHSLVRGVPCHFGERCRFNHDMKAFLRSKGPELPGCCPFLSAGTCVYGESASVSGRVMTVSAALACEPVQHSTADAVQVCRQRCARKPARLTAEFARNLQMVACAGMACMWASTHTQGDQALLRLPEHAAANGSATNGNTVNGTAANGVSGNSAGTTGDAAVPAQLPLQPASDEGHSGVTDDSGVSTTVPVARAEPAGSLSDTAARSNGEASCEGLAKGPLVLPAPECLRPELNGVDRDLQNTLRCPFDVT